ncbi:MAG: hypothetical protein IKA36_00060 [Clostridia bacterium]|nr:hypothetical protein [Clostridia bacterium]
MQVFSTTVSEVITHVHQVIADQVCRKIISQLGLRDVFKNHLYLNSDFYGPSKSSSEVRLPILHENAFKCNVKYSANPFGLKWDSTTPGQHLDPAIHRRDTLQTLPVFYDKKHNIQLIERYIPCNVEMDCSMIFVDRVLAYDVMTRLASTYVRGELMMVNDLSYDYRMPMEVLNRLYMLGTQAGLQKGTYLDWLERGSNGLIQRIVSKRQRNRHAEIVIKKQQFGSLAAVDYNADQPPIQTLGTSADTVTIQFTVTVQFGRVNMLYLKYPIMINNQLIPEQLVTVDKEEMFGKLYPFIQHPYLALNNAYQFQKVLMEHPVRNPWYDDWTVPINCSLNADFHRPFFIGLFTLDNENCQCSNCTCKCCNNKYTTINIREDFDKYKLSEEVLTWFKENPDKAFDSESPYALKVFSNNTEVGASLLLFDGENLRFPNCKGPENVYHLVVSAKMMDFLEGRYDLLGIPLVELKVDNSQGD